MLQRSKAGCRLLAASVEKPILASWSRRRDRMYQRLIDRKAVHRARTTGSGFSRSTGRERRPGPASSGRCPARLKVHRRGTCPLASALAHLDRMSDAAPRSWPGRWQIPASVPLHALLPRAPSSPGRHAPAAADAPSRQSRGLRRGDDHRASGGKGCTARGPEPGQGTSSHRRPNSCTSVPSRPCRRLAPARPLSGRCREHHRRGKRLALATGPAHRTGTRSGRFPGRAAPAGRGRRCEALSVQRTGSSARLDQSPDPMPQVKEGARCRQGTPASPSKAMMSVPGTHAAQCFAPGARRP